MNYTKIITLFTFLIISCTLGAQASCPAPAPASASIDYYGNTEIGIEWAEVVGAVSYEVVVRDDQGSMVDATIVNTTSFIQQNLQAGQEYNFEIRSSYCTTGPYGPVLSLVGGTTVIVVDIIFQTECFEPEMGTISESILTGTPYVVEMNALYNNGCYKIEINPSSNPELAIDIAIKIDRGNLVIGNLSTNSEDFYLDNKGTIQGGIRTDEHLNIPLLDIKTETRDDGAINIIFDWKQDVEVTLVYCPNCGFEKEDADGGGTALRGIDTSTENNTVLKLYPNPARNTLQIQLPMSFGQLEINDLAGRRWYYSQGTIDGSNLYLQVDQWPAGGYILRWQEENKVPVIQYLMKI